MGMIIGLMMIVMVVLVVENHKQRACIKELNLQLNRIDVEVIRLGVKKELDQEKLKLFDELCGGYKNAI